MMIYVLAIEVPTDADGNDDFYNDVDEVTNYINDVVQKGVLNARPLSEIVSC